VRIRLENVKTRNVQVKAQLLGKLPKPLRLKSIWVEPPFVTLQGPEGTLAKVREILTDPVDLSSLKESMKISLGLEITPPQLRLAPNQPSQVSVEIRVE